MLPSLITFLGILLGILTGDSLLDSADGYTFEEFKLKNVRISYVGYLRLNSSRLFYVSLVGWNSENSKLLRPRWCAKNTLEFPLLSAVLFPCRSQRGCRKPVHRKSLRNTYNCGSPEVELDSWASWHQLTFIGRLRSYVSWLRNRNKWRTNETFLFSPCFLFLPLPSRLRELQEETGNTVSKDWWSKYIPSYSKISFNIRWMRW